MWEQIRSNQRRTAFVVTAMGVLLCGTGAAVGVLLGGGRRESLYLGAGIAFAFWLVLWWLSRTQGDNMLLTIAGAREVKKKDHPQLVNVVEEMAIAARLPQVPKTFIVDDPSPNAFATGLKPDMAGVTVTTGLLRILNRDELQGVVAHEIGHIRNRDVSLMTTAGIMVGCIVLLAELGMRIVWHGGAGGRRSRTSSKDDGGAQAVMMVVALLLVILAPILAQLIYFALSRKREYLADASGAMYSRYPEGLASALEKLGGSRVPLADESRVTKGMYIVRPLRKAGGRATSLFSTHPPLRKRVEILRSMAGGAGLREYETAFREATGGSAIGNRTLAGAQPLMARGAMPVDGGADAPAVDASASVPDTPRTRQRAAMDAYISASGYSKRSCTNCGAVMKIPPPLQDKVRRCLRCDTPFPA